MIIRQKVQFCDNFPDYFDVPRVSLVNGLSTIVMKGRASYNASNVTLHAGTIKMALPKKKTIALIAHDGKKAEMISFVKDNIEFFKKFELVATSTTGKLVAQTGLKVKRYLSGPVGGDAQITALVATQKCHAVIFMRDPLGMHPHEPDIYSLLRICDVHDVPLATNLSSAELIVKGLAKNLLKE